MKGKIFSIGVVVLLAMLTSAWAADIDGTWIAKVAGTQGQEESEITLKFKADGTKLTGTLNNTIMPGDVEIKEGKIDGDKVSFSLMRTIGENEMKVVWKGTVSGDEIKFTRGIEGGMGGPGGGAGGGPGGGAGAATEIIANRKK